MPAEFSVNDLIVPFVQNSLVVRALVHILSGHFALLSPGGPLLFDPLLFGVVAVHAVVYVQ